MNGWILLPPVAFILIFILTACFSRLLGRLSFKPGHAAGAGSRKAYACGEDIPQHKVQVNYGQFFPFAFFFTILHVLAMMVATVPIETMSSFSIAVIYIIGGMTGLIILFRR